MDRSDLSPLAGILVPSYLETAAHSRSFRDEYGSPPTLLAKVHHMRSIIQAKVTDTERLSLDPRYSEFGRVQVTDEMDGHQYLLRSDGAVAVERAKRQGRIFDPAPFLVTNIILVVYHFHRDGLDLAVAGTHQEVGRTRLEASGEPTYIGTWPFTPDDGQTSFSQGAADAFEELGDMPLDGEEDESK